MLGLGGNPQLAADVGIVQGAALALFLTFSGNARNLILKSGGVAPVREIALVRLILVLPLSACVYYLGTLLGGVAWDITSILILRKAIEWLTEIHLGEAEREQDAAFAFRHLLIQSLLLSAVAVWILTDAQGLLFVMMLWALTPLLMSLRYFQTLLRDVAKLVPLGTMLPHLGSSAVTGIGFYAFRLAILLLAGKVVAGDLYTAFAIGGLLGSVFAVGLGPSLVLHEQNFGCRRMPAWLLGLLVLTSLAGLAISGAAHLLPSVMIVAGKQMFFWHALGLSLMGGVVMVFAHRQRLRDLQHGTQDDVFAPDVLVNIAIVLVVPASYFVFGLHSLSWLYLINATVALLFYWMADVRRATVIVSQRHINALRIAIATLVVMPLFLTLGTGVFRSEEIFYDSLGLLSRLPIPVSVLACFAGIILLGSFRRANLALTAIFLFFVLMILATVATTFGSSAEERSKFLLLLQYVMPTFGLVLGMTYEGQKSGGLLVAKSGLVVIAALMPLQLIASWAQHHTSLTPYLYLFSIYQHLEYVPAVVAGSFIFGLFSLWNLRSWRVLILLLTPVFATYLVVSGSMAAASFSLIGYVVFGLKRLRASHVNIRRTVWKVSGLVSGLVFGLGVVFDSSVHWRWKFSGIDSRAGKEAAETHLPGMTGFNLSRSTGDRIDIWSFHLHEILADPSTFLFGHAAPLARSVWPSAHNYYLDVAYNFGVLATLVIIGLVVITTIRLYRYRESVLACSSTTGLMLVVMYLTLLDSLIKVSLRQPYSGIFAFFLWGLLLARIDQLRTAEIQKHSLEDSYKNIDLPLNKEGRVEY